MGWSQKLTTAERAFGYGPRVDTERRGDNASAALRGGEKLWWRAKRWRAGERHAWLHDRSGGATRPRGVVMIMRLEPNGFPASPPCEKPGRCRARWSAWVGQAVPPYNCSSVPHASLTPEKMASRIEIMRVDFRYSASDMGLSIKSDNGAK